MYFFNLKKKVIIWQFNTNISAIKNYYVYHIFYWFHIA